MRGFAAQRLRKPADPENPSNRRISIIVKYVQAPPAPEAPAEKGKEEGKEKGKEKSKE